MNIFLYYLTHGWRWSGTVLMDGFGLAYAAIEPRHPRVLALMPGEWGESVTWLEEHV